MCLWRSWSTGLVPHSLAGEGHCVQGEPAGTIPGFSQYSLPPSQCISMSLSLRLLETPRVSTRQGRGGGRGGESGGRGGLAALKQEVGFRVSKVPTEAGAGRVRSSLTHIVVFIWRSAVVSGCAPSLLSTQRSSSSFKNWLRHQFLWLISLAAVLQP